MPPTKKSAIVKSTQETGLAVLNKAKETAELAFSAVSEALSASPSIQTVVAIQETVKSWMKRMESAEKITKQYLKEYVVQQGTDVPDTKGSKTAEIGGYRVSVRPVRTGYDSKKFEALVLAKGYVLGTYMDQNISYSLNESKMKALEAEALTKKPKFTQAELDACRYDQSFALQPLEKI